ncbi:hypothetical protein ABTZ78_15405 [Streptomyces bauhiniae]
MNDHPEAPVRAATAADVPAVRAVTDAAYLFVIGEPITGEIYPRYG